MGFVLVALLDAAGERMIFARSSRKIASARAKGPDGTFSPYAIL
jgi:hypothetical protein